MKMSNDERFLELAKAKFGNKQFPRKAISDLCVNNGLKLPRTFLKDPEHKVGRGVYSLEKVNVESTPIVKPERVVPDKLPTHIIEPSAMINVAISHGDAELVPKKDPLFIQFGNYGLISKVIASNIFYPVFITGLSGNGKTMMVEQACAEHKRELYRINLTIETDEDDLLGGFRLVQDSTKWFDGPVVRAMKSGGVLLLDEVDLASTKIMCLQPIMEGKGVFLKKINQFVKPAPGFTVVATANTKGQGNDTGKFVGTSPMNEAFLERFPITFEQDYPTESVEKKILKKVFSTHGMNDQDEFINVLTAWANGNRISYKNEATTEVITTRRLVHIAHAYSIFRDRRQAIELCIARFDEITKQAFITLYESLDVSLNRRGESPKDQLAFREDPVEALFGVNV